MGIDFTPRPANADLVGEVLLRYFREPGQYRAEMLRANEVSSNLDLVLRLALGKPVEFANPSFRVPGVARELARAALFFVGQTISREDASHYQILGLTPDATAEAIRENHRLLIQLVHPDRQTNDAIWPENIAARVNRAYSVLKNSDTRAAYDHRQSNALHRQQSTMRNAATFAASAGGNVHNRRTVQPSVFPEWLTAGVGGLVRQHPAFTIFAALISLSALTITAIVWSEHDGTLTRDESQLAVGGAARSGVRINGQQSNYTIAPRPAPDAPVWASSNPTLRNPAKPDNPPLTVAIGAPQTRDLASPPTTNPASKRSPELAMVSLNRSENRIGARTGESLAPTKASAPTATLSPGAEAPSPRPTSGAWNLLATNEPIAPATPVAVATAPKQSATPEASATPPVSTQALASPPPAPMLVMQATAPANVTTAKVIAAPSRSEPLLVQSPLAPNSAEVEALIAAFISNFEGGRLDAFAALFDTDARTNEFRGRDAIRSDYGELFRRSGWRRMSVRRLKWHAEGERTAAVGEISVKIGWRDGREVEQRIGLEMDLMRQGGRTVIARLSQQVRN